MHVGRSSFRDAPCSALPSRTAGMALAPACLMSCKCLLRPCCGLKVERRRIGSSLSCEAQASLPQQACYCWVQQRHPTLRAAAAMKCRTLVQVASCSRSGTYSGHRQWSATRAARCCCSRQGRPLYAMLQRRPASPSNFQRSRAHQTAVTARAPASYMLQTGPRRPDVQHRRQPQARGGSGHAHTGSCSTRARARAHARRDPDKPRRLKALKSTVPRAAAPTRHHARAAPPPAGAWRTRRPACPHPPRAPGPG